ncbi:unnamed protein product [Ceutorhynchus assimilis]|uniref:Nucleolus and neural progenitor protein-like N-terminal domain-containing protein n=1 Tax=Ceutorhynchus assimilis TaxID=467358 RepID=A0A9N9MHC5_9CUCU|nr:unnamed protein product [Ceutorhynchus assimilis]
MDNNPLWNRKDLFQPPVSSYKASTEDLDLTKFRLALQDGIRHFKDKFLATEATLLARIIYRMKMKFRSAKDFKLIETLSRSLNIYFNTDLSRHLKGMLDMTPKRYGWETETYLPARNMLSFILVRLQGIVKLLEKIYETAEEIAIQLTHRLYRGHFWTLFLILYGLVSRISVLIKFNTKFFCELYGKLHSHLNKLENTGKNWLPNGYDFPVDLRSWLGVNWVYEDIYVDLTFTETNKVMTLLNLVDDDEDDDVLFCDEYIVVDDEDENTKKKSNRLSFVKEVLARNRMRGFNIDENDIGEEIIEINDTIITGNNVKQPQEVMCLGNISENEIDSGQDIDIENPDIIFLDTPLPNKVQKSKTKSKINKSANKIKQSPNKKSKKEKSKVSKINAKQPEEDFGEEIICLSENNKKEIDIENPDIIILDTPLPNVKKSKRKSEKINQSATKRKRLNENGGSPKKQSEKGKSSQVSKKGKKKMEKENKDSSIILSDSGSSIIDIATPKTRLNVNKNKKRAKYECFLSKLKSKRKKKKKINEKNC